MKLDTMNAPTLLAHLSRQGITVEPTGLGDLLISPRDKVTDDIIEAIRARKPDLIRILTGRVDWLRSEP